MNKVVGITLIITIDINRLDIHLSILCLYVLLNNFIVHFMDKIWNWDWDFTTFP